VVSGPLMQVVKRYNCDAGVTSLLAVVSLCLACANILISICGSLSTNSFQVLCR